MVGFAIGDSFALDIEPLSDVHQASGNKLGKLDGSVAELDYKCIKP
jgi:hypothetical protein